MKCLEDRKEYEVEDIYYNILFSDIEDDFNKNLSQNNFLDVKSTYQFLRKNKSFSKLFGFYHTYYEQHFTSGIVMLIVALMQGYNKIYLTGIDFYGGGVDYAFSVTDKKNFLWVLPKLLEKDFKDKSHSKDLDIKAIEIAKSIKGVEIYCLTPDTPLNQIIPLAPQITKKVMQIEEKPSNAIKDFMQLPGQKKISETCNLFEKFRLFLIKKEIFDIARENLIFRIVRDFIFFIKTLMGFLFFLFKK